MTLRMPPEMAEATRLTRAGKLTEATALIQRMLRGDAAEPAGARRAPVVIDAEYDVLDAARPQAPEPAARLDRRPGSAPRTGLRETLRGLAARAKAAARDMQFKSPRPAPEPVPEGATFAAASYSNAAGTRAYRLFTPSRRTAEPMPLIVMLHGCTQSSEDFAAGTRMNVLAEAHGFLVAYPEQPASANQNNCWNWFSPGDQSRDRGEPSLIAGITRQVMRDHRVDAQRVYIAGLSAGGAAAAIMAAAYPDLFAAVGVHSGLPAGAARDLPSAFAAMRDGAAGSALRVPVPTIIFHGDQDATVHPRNGEAVAAQSTAAATGLRKTAQRGEATGGHAYSRVIHADASGRAVCEHWTIHGAGHAWAGGCPSGSYTDPRGPDASREMLRFFLAQDGAAA